MTTASTNTTVSHTSSADLQAWATEIDTNLVTNCGLTNTTDTGQTATGSLTYSATLNSVAGFRVYKFNDTLQATSPIFIKMEFGTGASSSTAPAITVTVGSSTNGAGTITGIAGTRVSCTYGSAPNSTVSNNVSRYCYNTTQGVLGFQFKIGNQNTGSAFTAIGGLHIFRSVDASGAPTSVSALILSNNLSNLGTSASGPFMQGLGYSLTTTFPPTASTTQWATIPLNAATTLAGTNGQVFPAFQWAPTSSTPPYGITNAYALGVNAEIPMNVTVTVTILGTTSLTYMSSGVGCGNATYNIGYIASSYAGLMLWQ